MIKFSKRVEYALVAMAHLMPGNGCEKARAKDISEQHDCPEEYMGKVLQKLTRAGLLESVQGARGGYRLARPLAEITVGMVVEAVGESPVKPKPSGAADGGVHEGCQDACTCYVRDMLGDIQGKVMDYLETLSLDKVLGDVPREEAALLS